ncbi:MAG: NAD-dependent epimerase [Acidithiobacillus ferriphilus]|jgi:Nucleoside-diphosphate-sugar epimerases|nr:NAD-dependent epimerase [Acidithiobacillus ferriphilus]MBU2785753.1 NAD-dependent epimerase [Acidithiobacillus ferriphilus]MBU2826819.1 NAD-dependent epimerase [Acidithiobacillus ferriphilus]MBU2849494.1 NAD-dependent epimerase [Acidithiobacillus ferriphilus]MEB8476218.1 NAD-dependent epimerase [Acidithiobacillus ferriphilus]MEB8537167.1 NAD-dependent epimerase [Acidithiobacillus ferriphilus]
MDGRVLVTGAAGFIGFHMARRLLADGWIVSGIDNLNDYYDPSLKRDRLAQLEGHPAFQFQPLDLANREAMQTLFAGPHFDVVINLAAQAGVRHSLKAPHSYVDSNVVGFLNVLEGCRAQGVSHLLFASSSSVYGANNRLPYSVHDPVDHPLSLYAATKRAGELVAHSYAHLYGIPSTGLRFFTVYGPWGRPDMAYFSFTQKILAGQPIPVFNHGQMRRDFTYIDDIIEGVTRLIPHAPEAQNIWPEDPASSAAPFCIHNIGNHTPIALTDFIHTLEECLGKSAQIEWLPMQDGDVVATYADVSPLQQSVDFAPDTSLHKGLQHFVTWYRQYYG